MKTIALIAAILALPSAALAGGFAVAEQSATAGGTGGAATARSDAGSAYYNPASLADGGGLIFGLGVTLARPSLSAEALDGSFETSSDSGLSTPPNLHAAYAVGDFAAGVYLGVPFGGSVEWPENWAGRHEIMSSSLRVFRAAPFVAWRFGDIRIAAGPNLDAGQLQIRRSLDFVDTEGDVRLNLRGTAVGAHASLFFAARPDLDLGVSYKSRAKMKLSGEADFDSPDEFAQKTRDQSVRSELSLPDRIALGGAYKRDSLRVLADVEVTLWSVNQELVVDFEEEATPDPMQINDWSTTVAVRGGAEYQPHRQWLVRGGAFFDPAPSPASRLSPSSPDGNRVGGTVGATLWAVPAVAVDAFFEHMEILGRGSENPDSLAARYSGRAELFGIGVRYQPEPSSD